MKDGVEQDPDEGLGNGGLAREKGLGVREKEERKTVRLPRAQHSMRMYMKARKG